MNKRFCKFGRNWVKALCVISVCGAVYSCTDDYELDDKSPSWLGKSIYDYLQTQGNYTNFVRLINDQGDDYVEVMKKTGSKTLFVANDSAFAEFYKENQWGVSSYDELTPSQKKLLLNSSMLSTPNLLEMLSNAEASGDEGPQRGKYLRRVTELDVTDSVPHFTADEVPISYFEDKTLEKDYWARFRDPSKGGIYLALDNTQNMMVHFLANQMGLNNITDEDFKYITGQERAKNDAFIYDCRVVEQDITCQNGYVNRLDRVLVPRQNMAEVLRTNGDTKIFSHMLDRFSAPFYSKALTDRYRLLYGNTVDSVFQKRYFSKRSQNNLQLNNDLGTSNNPNGNEFSSNEEKLLTFDPGWNSYQADGKQKEEDMGIIFAPCDERLYDYFFSADGGGRFLLEAYAQSYLGTVQGANDYTNIYKCIDQIPLDVISALINNLMKNSFVSSVPSKFETIKDDAQDPMFTNNDADQIKKFILANNGAICIMDEVITPAKYASVSAPAYVGTDMKIFKQAFSAATLGGTQTNFDRYLLAMSSRFSFFVPTDGTNEQDNSFWYIDPASFLYSRNDSKKPRALHYTWDGSKVKCTAYDYNYDYTTGIGSIDKEKTQSISTTEWENRLKDMLETHTIVHEDQSEIIGFDETKTGIECAKQWFITKSGAPLHIKNATSRDHGCQIQGGWQNAQNEWCTVTRFDDKTKETNGNGNGMAYQIDGPVVPTIESVYSVMYNNQDKFGKFFELCQTDADVLEAIGVETKNSEGVNDQKKFMIFYNDGNYDQLPCFDKENGDLVTRVTGVRFFNNYRYTIYIPTNAAVEEAINNGLPTWSQLREMLRLDDDDAELNLSDAEKKKYQAMALSIVNFVRYHFQDNSIFADAPSLNAAQYETACYQANEESGVGTYSKLKVSSTGGETLQIEDAAGHKRNLTADKNILVRDYSINKSNVISASSFAVIHGIDGVLNYHKYGSNGYREDYENLEAAKRYLAKYRINE